MSNSLFMFMKIAEVSKCVKKQMVSLMVVFLSLMSCNLQAQNATETNLSEVNCFTDLNTLAEVKVADNASDEDKTKAKKALELAQDNQKKACSQELVKLKDAESVYYERHSQLLATETDRQDFKRFLKDAKFKDIFANILYEQFNRKQLQDLVVFFKSDTGKILTEKETVISDKLQIKMQPLQSAHLNAMQEKRRSEAKKAKALAPTSGASDPAATPSTESQDTSLVPTNDDVIGPSL